MGHVEWMVLEGSWSGALGMMIFVWCSWYGALCTVLLEGSWNGALL